MSTVKSAHKVVSPSEVIWFPENNFGKHASQFDNDVQKAAHAVQLKDGWWPTEVVKVVKLTDEGKKKAVEFLTALYDALTKLLTDVPFPTTPEVKLSNAQFVLAFRERWMSKDKIVAPEYEGVYAFQRGGCIDWCNALRMSAGLKPLDGIPIMIMEYKDRHERIEDCMMENFGKVAGFKDVTNHWPTIMKGCKEHFESTNRTSTLTQITRVVTGGDTGKAKVGRGQKAYAILALDAKFPNLGIIQKITEAGFGKYEGRDGVDLGQAYGESISRSRATELEQGTRVGAKEEVSPDDVAAYFTDPKAAKKVTIVPMNKNLLNTRMQLTPNNLVKYILFCVLNNKVESLAKLDATEITKACNAIAEANKLETK